MQRLKREILVWAALKHPNIVEFKGYVVGVAEYPAMVSKVRKITLISMPLTIYDHVN
jgi:hypothetical protein